MTTSAFGTRRNSHVWVRSYSHPLNSLLAVQREKIRRLHINLLQGHNRIKRHVQPSAPHSNGSSDMLDVIWDKSTIAMPVQAHKRRGPQEPVHAVSSRRMDSNFRFLILPPSKLWSVTSHCGCQLTLHSLFSSFLVSFSTAHNDLDNCIKI